MKINAHWVARPAGYINKHDPPSWVLLKPGTKHQEYACIIQEGPDLFIQVADMWHRGEELNNERTLERAQSRLESRYTQITCGYGRYSMDKKLFSSNQAMTQNRAGGKAYSLSAKEALAQYSATCMFGNTYYASAEEQLEEVLKLASQCEPEFVAKCAVYARQKGYLKDMPAFLLATLVGRGELGALRAAWPHVIENGKMLRNFAQAVRSGVAGRKSFGTATKRLINNWLLERNAERLFKDSIGASPSLADVIKMTHPKPSSPEQAALFRYLIGKPVEDELQLPRLVREYENWKLLGGEPPEVPFQMLSQKQDLDWFAVARTASWTTTRMNLNTFARHGVLKDQKMVELIAARLKDANAIKWAKCYPYQLLTTYMNVDVDIPREIKDALQDAMEIATANAPDFKGRIVICPDVSGSMHSPVSGSRPGTTSKTTCVAVAALIAAVLMRKSSAYNLMPFSDRLYSHKLDHRDSIMTLAQQIVALPSGGTDCSLPLRAMNEHGFDNLDTVVYISDNESWMDRPQYGFGNRTGMMAEFTKLQKRVPNVKLVCIDLTPNSTTQVPSAPNRLNVGGFSDAVFDVISNFISGESSNWVAQIEKVVL